MAFLHSKQLSQLGRPVGDGRPVLNSSSLLSSMVRSRAIAPHSPIVSAGHQGGLRSSTTVKAATVVSPTAYYYRDPTPWPTDIQLPPHDLEKHPYVDLVVVGAGPSGAAVAERVAQAGFSVCVIDPKPHAPWPNNYGAWVDEFQAMDLLDCMEVIWPKAKVWLDSSPTGEKFLNRPYGRVDRPQLKRKLFERCVKHGVTFLEAKVESAAHGGGCSTVKLGDGSCIQGSLVLDCSGHSRRLVEYDQPFDPGYQGAYGIICEVESHPFDLQTMLFMDWRDDHTHSNPQMRRENEVLPTFLYAMPFSKTKIFLEETSLVARPAVGFKDLKERLDARLNHLGIKVKHIEEEEYCLIPMGGVLPKHPQRVLALGGTAGMVHPSTGFMVSRMLGAAPTVADAIVEQLSRPADRADRAGEPRRPQSEEEAQAMAEAVWRATWPVERLQQRLFFTFGMDVLLSLNLFQMREFFAAFFSLSAYHWHGFLSTRLSFIQLIGFGLALFVNASSDAKLNLLQQGVPGLVKMLLQLAPTLGEYYKVQSVKQQKHAQDVIAARAQAQGASPRSMPVVGK